ncbi:MAG TPA: hypothetical protein PLD73_03425 [Candidatus Hydrogenedentes bacterium]|jgi:hypothetical protein|nr:hypothetical protein [Candidatus Hydrogenedentota bacterium]HPK00774.1 hypothetical protein [Candidatus Hydrogenedentota bacterium]
MQHFICDGCSKEMKPDDTRYRVKIDVRVAKGSLEFSLLDLFRDHRKELENLVKSFEGKDPRELEETIYKGFELDLCPRCQRAYIRDPLRFHPEQGLPDVDIDIDAFLRSLRQHSDNADETEE